MKKSLVYLSVVASLALADGSYTLGKVSVQSSIADDINMIEQSISSRDITQNNERNIAESLDNMSGVSMNSSGARGESKISIRGHNANRIGVFIDGIPVYIPYDGNFDFGRFLTNDVAEIDISKGFSSVAYGANTMGGVVNIVTKKPTKELEGNIRGEIVLDSHTKMARHLESLNVGSRVGGFYGQLSGTYSKRDHFRMSDDYVQLPSSDQPKGDRLRSENRDHKISFKTGYIADDMSEIALSYANQKGKKQHPINTDPKNKRFMDSPYWNKETISLTSVKNFGESYLKALVYYDKSQNSMNFHLDNTYTTFDFNPSRYDDYSYGARVEYGLETDRNFLKIAANYKKDIHRAYETDKITNIESIDQRLDGHTISLGVEDNYKFTNDLELLAGASYDRLKADKVFYPDGYQGLDTISAFNPQAAIVYTLTPASKLRASASQKTYLPSMKDRYSGGMGSKKPNPDLDKEIANHYELGYTYQTQSLLLAANIYFTKVKDAIEGMKTNDPQTKSDGSPKTDKKGNPMYKDQNQNVGSFDHKGFEIDSAYKHENTKVGANYTYANIKNKRDSSVKRTSMPKHQVFAFAEQKIGAGFSLYGNIKLRSGVYEQDIDWNQVEMPSYTTFDAKVIYEPTKELLVEIGVKNLTDKLIQYDYGFPEAGREYFATMNYKF